MDELELLKKQWQKQEQNLPHLSFNDIYKMILKKSSSIVKWLFYISIGEVLFWTVFTLLLPKRNYEIIDELGLGQLVIYSNIVYYIIFLTFIYLFYQNHKKISATSNAKELMQNILRTRNTVKYLIIFNISWMGAFLIGLNIFYSLNPDLILSAMRNDPNISTLDKNELLLYFFIGQVIFGIILIGGLLLFYRIIYGIFLRRLHKNYKELERMEG